MNPTPKLLLLCAAVFAALHPSSAKDAGKEAKEEAKQQGVSVAVEMPVNEHLGMALASHLGSGVNRIGEILLSYAVLANYEKKPEACKKAISANSAQVATFNFPKGRLVKFLTPVGGKEDEALYFNPVLDKVRKSKSEEHCLQRMTANIKPVWEEGSPRIVVEGLDGCVTLTVTGLPTEPLMLRKEDTKAKMPKPPAPQKFLAEEGCQLELFYPSACVGVLPDAWDWEITCLFGRGKYVDFSELSCDVHNSLTATDSGVYTLSQAYSGAQKRAYIEAKDDIRHRDALKMYKEKGADVTKEQLDAAEAKAKRGSERLALLESQNADDWEKAVVAGEGSAKVASSPSPAKP